MQNSIVRITNTHSLFCFSRSCALQLICFFGFAEALKAFNFQTSAVKRKKPIFLSALAQGRFYSLFHAVFYLIEVLIQKLENLFMMRRGLVFHPPAL